MRDAATQNRRRNERAKRWTFRDIVKWRRWRHVPRLTASLLRLFTSTRSLLLFRSRRQRQLPRTRAEMTRCRHQKLHWRWPGNPNGRSKLRNLLCLRLQYRNKSFGGGSAADGGFRRSLKRHIADIKNIARKDQNRSKFHKYKNLDLRNQAKCLKKIPFAAKNDAAIDGIAHCFFSYYHSHRLLFPPTKNNFSTTFNPTKKQRYTQFFFVDSIYSKTINIIRKKQIFYF